MIMKKLKRETAVLMAIVMACSAAAPCGPVLTASAASQKQVKLNVKSKTLKIGQKGYKLKLVNNKQGWKIKKVSTTNAAVCKPYGRKKAYVLLEGKGTGSASVKVKVMRTVLKKGKKITKSRQLSCKVRVKADTPDTPTTEPVQSGDVTASSQEQLEAALKNTGIETLRFQTDAEDTFTIPEGDYRGIDLIVDAPNADMVNNGIFKSISVQAVKDNTWLENAVGNILAILAKAARIVVQPEADVSGITFVQAGAKVSLEVKGNVKEISFQAPDANAKVSAAQGSSIGNVSVAETAERAKVDMDINGTVEDVELSAPRAEVNVAVADIGAVNKVSLEEAADSAKIGLDVKGRIENVNLSAPQAEVNMAVADVGAVNKVSLGAAAGSAKAGFDVKGNIQEVELAAPQADVNMAVAAGGGVNKVSLEAAADSAKVGLDVKGTVSDISLDASKAEVSVAVNDNGKVNGVTVSKEMNVALSGTTKTAVALKVSAAAAITASTDVALESSVSLSLILEKGAEGSSVKISGNTAAVGIKIQNKTEGSITVNTPAGNITVEKNSGRDVTVNAPAASGGSSSGGSSSGGSSSGGSSSGGSSSGGSSSGGSSSGGSSSGGSSSGGAGSEDDKKDTEPTGIFVENTYLTMKVGEEQNIYFSADPKEGGRLENVEANVNPFDNEQIFTTTMIYKQREIEGLTLKAEKPGYALVTVAADVIGNDEDSPILLPNQSRIIVVRVAGNEEEETPAAALKLTSDSTSVEKGGKVRLKAELDAPAGAKIEYNAQFDCVRQVNGNFIFEDDGSALEITDTMTSGSFLCRLKGKGEIVAYAVVQFPDGTKRRVVSNVIEVEVTDSSPDPSPEETSIYASPFNNKLQVGKTNRLLLYFGDVHAYSARMLKVKWTSENPGIAQVQKAETKYKEEGSVLGAAVGTTKIKAEVTVATLSKTFTKEVSFDVEVETAPPVPEMKIVSSVRVVTEGAIDPSISETYGNEDIGKTAFELLRKNVSAASENSNVKYSDFMLDTRQELEIPGVRIVTLRNEDGYGFVIQNEGNIESGTLFKIPIAFWMERGEVRDRYYATVEVTISKNNNQLEAAYTVTEIKSAAE